MDRKVVIHNVDYRQNINRLKYKKKG